MGLLYHYTNAAGLIGILGSQVLWATDAKFLNDSLEMQYARDKMLEAVRKESTESTDPIRSKILRYIDESMRDEALVWPPVYVSCFCEDWDLLSQWRAYGGEQGYAIGFDRDVLHTVDVQEDARSRIRSKIPNLPPNLLQVMYGEAATRSAISDAVRVMGYGQSGGGHYGVVAVNEVAWFVLPELCRIKHPSFKEEKEWRLVFVIWEAWARMAHFRPSALGVVPYIEIPVPPECIREIVLGPGNHPKTRLAGIHAILGKAGLIDVTVRTSESPLRTV